MKQLRFTFLFLLLLSAADAAAFTRVISVGTNRSYDQSLEILKFAEDDARKFALAMKTVGMVPDLKITTLLNPTVQSFRDTLSLLAREQDKLTNDRNKSKLIFYFSGHADENGLHFSDGLIPKAELHAFLTRSRHETRIAILDSCFSGALVAKGIRKSGEFDIPILNVDEPTGSIYLTSSSSSQFAYESDALSGSVFSHHLISGMYGDGDLNKDGIVTIDELYQYVYKNTKWHALTLPHKKAQDPEMTARLHGQGAVVLSYPVELDSVVHLPRDLTGVVSIASASGYQIFSIQKIKGEERQIKMPPGKYNYSIVDGGKAAQGQMQLSSHRTTYLESAKLSWKDTGETRREKGEAPARSLPPAEIAAVVGQAGNAVGMKNQKRYGAGLHSDLTESEYGPYLGASFGKRAWFNSQRWIGWGYGARFGAFRTEVDGDEVHDTIVNTAGMAQAFASLHLGIFEFGYGYGQMGVVQQLGGEASGDERRVAFPVESMIVGVHVPLRNGRTIGIEYVRESLKVAKVSRLGTIENSFSVQIHYGL